jgi:MFS family permease
VVLSLSLPDTPDSPAPANTREDLDSTAVEIQSPPAQIQDQKLKALTGRSRWFYSIFPFSVASGPISTYIQLAILHYYGQTTGTVYVGLIVTLFNGVSIPASMIWGFATDRFHNRKPMIVLSFLLVSADLFGLLFTRTIFGIGLVYSLFSLLSAASATPYNLLIMETEPKSSWASGFATFSMISTSGNIVGLVLSGVWVEFLPFQWLVIPLAIMSLASAFLGILLIKEPSFVFERQMIVLQKPSFYERLLQIPTIFLRMPRLSDFRRVFKGLRFDLTSQVPVLYLSIFAFNMAGGIFNTSLVPSMTANRLSQSEIYAVTFAAMVLQAISFRYAAPYIAKRTLVKTSVAGLALRGSSYAALGVSAYLIVGRLYIVPSFVFYPLAAGIAYAIYYTASNTMVFNSLGTRSHGSALGVYSALVGVATMAGSLISGFTSVYFGYYMTFLLAAFCLAMAALLTSSLSHLDQSAAKS